MAKVDDQIEAVGRAQAAALKAITIATSDSMLPNPPMVLEQLSKPVGDMNLLLDPIPFTSPTTSALLKGLVEDLIKKTNGIQPQVFGVFDVMVGRFIRPRMVVKWVLDRMPTLPDIVGVHQITHHYYEGEISGLKTTGHSWEHVESYRDANNKKVPRKFVIYFGPGSMYNSGARGVTVAKFFPLETEYRFLKDRYPIDWITRSLEVQQDKKKKIKYDSNNRTRKFEVEFREGDLDEDEDRSKRELNQATLISLLVQLGYFLKHGEFIDFRVLAIEVYRALNRIGTERASRATLYGLNSVLEVIERVMLLPLQQPLLAKIYGFPPESILIVGAPGVGKTTIARYLMGQQYNTVFVSVTTDKLLADLTSVKGSRILLEIDRIGIATQLPVVLLIDDVEAIMSGRERDATLISKILNFLQGIREKGFYILASTNYPERIDVRLLEPGRLSKIVYAPLPDADERLGILKLLTTDKPFVSEEDRLRILSAMAKATNGWTGRYLGEVIHEAGRISSEELLSRDLLNSPVLTSGRPLSMEHFEKARDLVLQGKDFSELQKWDERIRLFVTRRRKSIGFDTTGSNGKTGVE